MSNLALIEKTFAKEPKFRIKQAKSLIFKDFIGVWSQATVLPLEMREKLNKAFPLKINSRFFVSKKEDSIKALITLEDKEKIEAVLMRHGDRNTVCVSSQVGCPLACGFCVTGKSGFKRNLEDWEIIEQVLLFARYLKKEGVKVSNIVFMGMGEPFLNYDNVLAAIRILNDKDGFGLGARHFSISTVGIIEGIKKLALEPLQINLAVSLHAPNDTLRQKLMPISQKYGISEIMESIKKYISKTRRRVMFEYIMIKNVNDSDKEAHELVGLLKGTLCFVNLISCNANGGFYPSEPERIKKFKEILETNGIAVTSRWRYGDDINAACGQLVAGQEEKRDE
jgi:23S rRNA (adenine2503-C2)-methyltransferase